MGARVPFSRNSPAIFQGNNCGLLTNGGLAFKDGTVVHPYAGNPNGVLVLPIGSIVLDNVNAKLYQATDSLGTYVEVGSGGAALTFGRGLTGDGSVGDPLRMSGNYYPAVDAVDAFRILKADGVTFVMSVDTLNNRIFSNDTYLPTLPEDLVTKEYVDTEIAELPFSTKVNTFDNDSEVLFPQRGFYSGTVRPVTDQASLVAAIAASVTGDRIEVQNTFTITSTVTINKSVLLYAIGGAILQTAGAGTDPVTMFSVTAADVCFDSSLYIKHRKTTNTSVECAVNVNALSFISEARVEFMEFGYILRGSFRVSGPMTYTGALGNTHRFIAIYKVSDFSLIDGVVIDFPQEATARASFIFVSSSGATDVFDSHLCVRNCRQLNMSKYMRQFYMQESVTTTGDGLASLAFIGNSFNDLNGGFGVYASRANLLNFFYSIAVVNNWQGDAGIASYKGLLYLDSPAAPGDLGSTRIYYGGNRHPTNVRVDYTSAYDVGGICYKNTAYS